VCIRYTFSLYPVNGNIYLIKFREEKKGKCVALGNLSNTDCLSCRLLKSLCTRTMYFSNLQSSILFGHKEAGTWARLASPAVRRKHGRALY
jgi:hypothetical protein